jgi:hypothetical protein
MSSPAEWEKIVNSNEHEYKMMRRNIKSLISIMGMYLLVLAASDDDDDKFMAQQLNRAMQGMMFAFDFDTAEFVFKSPVASLSTMSESVQTFRAIMTLEEYKRNTPSHKKGDFKFTEKAENLLPYNKLIDAAENVADFGEE